MQPARRIDALKTGEPRYYTGTPCLRGHLSMRSTGSGACLECMKEGRRGKYKANQQAYNKRQRAEFAKLRDKRRRQEISA